MVKSTAQEEIPNSETELHRTQRPESAPGDFIWEEDVFKFIGRSSVNMTQALAPFPPALKESFKQAALAFSCKGDYAPSAMTSLFSAIGTALKRFPVSYIDAAWVSKALETNGFITKLGAIRSFFLFWKAHNPQAISEDGLQLLVRTKGKNRQSSNVLSDDPEKSWLSDEEYETLLASVWRHYEESTFSTSRTLMVLLALQYARRPIQLAQLKFQDVRNAIKDDISGMTGLVVSFPGVKDVSAQTGFRDSKFEHHPLPDHLWNLFEIQRNDVRSMVEHQLGTTLTIQELEKLPAFITAGRLEVAIFELTNHYGIDWRTQLDHPLFHTREQNIARTLSWNPNGHRDIDPPLSHRTGRPIVVTATRLRHTRARQLARKGVPLHVLSHWMGHTSEESLKAYYNDPAEDARKLDEIMAPALMPVAMAFAGNLLDSEEQATRHNDPSSRLEFPRKGELKNVGNCGKHSFCATTSVPIPCYRCRYFEPLVTAPHEEVLEALVARQEEEKQSLRIGGARNLLIPIDLSSDIIAVKNCISRCAERKMELGIK